MKDYLLKFLTAFAPENGCAQDALEWAILTNQLRLTYHLKTDCRQAAQQYDVIIDGYQRLLREQEIHDDMMAGLLGQIAA